MSYYTLKECLTTAIWEWKWEEVQKLSNDNLQGLCKLMAVPTSGTKQELINRLKTCATVREFLSGYENPEELKVAHKQAKLKEMAKLAGCWAGGNKYSLAASLLNWRANCSRQGMSYAKQLLTQAKQTESKQLTLNLF